MQHQKILFLSTFIFTILSCNAPEEFKYDLFISKVNIIDYESGAVIPNQDIGITGDHIAYIGRHRAKAGLSSKNVVDGTNKFAIPGLWDNHIHLRGGPNLINANKEFLSLFLVNGITGIRDAGGDLSKEVIKWKNDIAAGDLTGPVIFTSGPKIDGPEATWAGSIEIKDTIGIAKALDSLESLKVDFVKLYDSKITRTIYLEVLRQAKSRSLITSGHMPFTVLLRENIENGIGSIEHLYYILKGCSRKESYITEQIRLGEMSFWESFNALMESYDPQTAENSFELLRSQKTFVTPTLHIGDVLSNLKTDDHAHDPYLQYVDSILISTYEGRIKRALQATEEGSKMRLKLQGKFKQLTLDLQNAGVSLLAGSDCGAYNSYIYPGISLHKELQAMVAAGLSPLEALKSSTYNGAQFLKQDSLYGTIGINKAADILLLYKNPITDIKNTQEIHAVIMKGKILSKDSLKMLKASTRN